MTEAEDLLSNYRYSSLKLLMDKSPTLDSFDRKVHGASSAQASLFVEYKQLVREQETFRQEKIARISSLARQIRYYHVSKYIVRFRDTRNRVHYKNLRTGRFVKPRSRSMRSRVEKL